MTSGRGPALGARLYSGAMLYREDYRRLLRAGGLAAWLAVGVPVIVLQLFAPWRTRDELALAAWFAALLLFGAAFWRATARRAAGRGPVAQVLLLVAGEAAAVFALVALPPCFGLEGALLVLAAFQLGPILPRPAATAWIAAQSVGLLWLMWLHWGWHWGVVLAFAYMPFQFIADATVRLLAKETALRQGLAASNAELEATRELLAQSARLAERARIARDLHDLLGHHLTALSLNLEIASHKTGGEARERIATAQTVTKLLLGDVRGVVGALRGDDHLDLPAALRKLADGIPRPRVHVDASPALAIDDPAVGEVVLRCAQEIVTNAVRHARAENLWLDVERSTEGIRIRARDDGCGATDIAGSVAQGHGLAGLRERFEQRGGAVSFDTAPGQGFRIDAVLPLPAPSLPS
jgi:signal transduction histidine kinase